MSWRDGMMGGAEVRERGREGKTEGQEASDETAGDDTRYEQ
jgi:hypothetical protein